ncbi:substrate-binding domain-containing protein [Paenarthrobacter sp. NPDC092416]|uniref:substrate-binding domain-containing protein n=1 Tax=Paenarthrobacter sp. NPDC092416 TaxID=3364386 RepID=UPI0038224826
MPVRAGCVRRVSARRSVKRAGARISSCSAKATSGYSGRTPARKAHGKGNLPDAVFCGTDIVAAGSVRELTDAGLKVPGDIAVAGFDDSTPAEMGKVSANLAF